MKRRIIKFCFAIGLLLGFLTTCIDDGKVDTGIVTNASEPTLSDIKLVGKTASTVTLEGEVESSQGYPVTERGIVWGTSPELSIDKDFKKSLTDNNSGSILLTADDLKGSTTYYFRLYAKNLAGIGYSPARSEETNNGLGSVRTFILPANIHATTASAGGLIDFQGEGSIMERGVYFSRLSGMATKDSIISPMEKDSFVCDLTGLLPSTEYFILAYVKNTYGIFRGDTLSLKTGSGKPEVELRSVDPKANEAQVIARVTSIGDAPLIQRGFCWGKTEDPTIEKDSKILVSIGTVGGLTDMARDIQPLEANQVYFVRAFAENQFGITYTPSYQFITSNDQPTVITLDPINVGYGSAIFGGSILNVGASNVTKIGVCYSATNQNPTINDTNVEIPTSPITDLDVSHPFYTNEITGLRGGTTYYIRAYAINGINVPSYSVDTKILQTPPIFTQESESFIGSVRVEGSSAYFVIGEKGYLLGGDIGLSYISNLYSFNPALDHEPWGELNSYEGGSMIWQSVAVIDTRVFVLGGLGPGKVVKDDFYVYNLDNLWFPRQKGPDSAYLRAGFSLNNEVVYVGGKRDTANNEVWAYQVSLNTWSQKADFPVNQYGGIALTVNGSAYVGLGKNTAGTGNNQLWKSNGLLTSWTPEPVGTELSGNVLAGVTFNNKIYVIDKSLLTQRYYIFEYDPAVQVWTRKSELPYYGAWNIQFMYSIRGRIYIGFVNNDKVVSYDPLWDN